MRRNRNNPILMKYVKYCGVHAQAMIFFAFGFSLSIQTNNFFQYFFFIMLRPQVNA